MTDGLLTPAERPIFQSGPQGLNKQIASFRDPDGTVFAAESRIFRKVAAHAYPGVRDFLGSPIAQNFVQSRRVVRTREVPEYEVLEHLTPRSRAICESFGPGGGMLEHDRIWFPSYVYEWPPEMLYAAAELTLELAEASLAATDTGTS